MTLALAREILERAKRKAAALGVPMSIAITDAGGYLVALERMDGAGFLSPRIATAKAYAAAAFRAPGLALKERFKERPEFVAGVAAMSGELVISAGGLPLMDGDSLIGAIGVSGGTPDQDQACAEEANAGPR